MARMTVAAFLECVAEDEELQQALVELAADRGFNFTKDELANAEPGVTATPMTWQNIAQFPNISALSESLEKEGDSLFGVPEWVNATTVLAATNVVLCGALGWYLWRNKDRSF